MTGLVSEYSRLRKNGARFCAAVCLTAKNKKDYLKEKAQLALGTKTLKGLIKLLV